MVSEEVSHTKLILNLIKDLVSIPSITSDHEANSRALYRAREELYGYPIEEFIHPESNVHSLLFYNQRRRPNMFRVLLHGHLDVVPAQDPSQFQPKQEGRRLYGRGTNDMKSGAAALIRVFADLAKDLPYPIGLSLTTDEEVGGFNGAGYQVQEGVMANFVISGESSNLAIGNQHKGVLLLHARSETTGGHTAYNGDSDNALQQQINFLSSLNSLLPGSDGTWRTTASVTKIDTNNVTHNVVPSEADSSIAIRYVPEDDPVEIYRRVQEIDPKIKVTKDNAFGLAHNTPQDHPDLILLKHAILHITGENAIFEGKAGSSDLRHWTEKGSAGIDFGPSGGGLHTAEEYLEIDSLKQYSSILRHFLTSLS